MRSRCLIRRWTCAFIALLALSGCAGLQPHVKYTVRVPSVVRVPETSRIALFQFTLSDVSLGDPAYARMFTRYLESHFRMSHYRMVSPERATAAFLAKKIFPSRLRDPGVVRALGRELEVDYFLFGDIPRLTQVRRSATKRIQRQIGEKEESTIVVQPDGTSATVVQVVPVYQEVLHEEISRITEAAASCRLVRVADAAVVWENSASDVRRDRKELEDHVVTVGEAGQDEDLVSRALSQVGWKLVENLLPREVQRIRYLAQVSGGSDYARLVNLGNQAAMLDDWQKAGHLWLKALNSMPQAPEARGNLGILRERSGEFVQAFQDYQYAASLLGKPWHDYIRDLATILPEENP